jgi:OOP family OmpA-OmpF porin
MKKIISIMALLTGLSALPLAQAADSVPDDRWYVAPFASFVRTDTARKAADGWGGGLAVGKIVNEYFNVELKGYYQGFNGYSTRAQRNGSWDLTGATADVQYFFNRDTFSPYAVAAVGGMNTNLLGSSAASFVGELGAGFTYELDDNLLVRSDVRYRYNNNFDAHLLNSTDEYHDMVINLGFVIPIGPKPTALAAAPAPIAARPVDDCSTRDTDHDGINDCLDKCPGTLRGAKVDDSGCPIRIELKGVTFKYDSAELTDHAKTILNEVSSNLIDFPQKKEIEVQGHTSSEGTSAYNLKLSQRRSQSVVDYLKQKGVTNRLRAKGYGEEVPVADNRTEAGRSQNRRVELVWIGE